MQAEEYDQIFQRMGLPTTTELVRVREEQRAQAEAQKEIRDRERQYFMTARRDGVTYGPWTNERASCEAFDAVMSTHSTWWTVRPEVHGRLTHPAPWQTQGTRLIIDRVLLPTPALQELGWPGWPVGVEIKRSGVPCGPALSQAIDYTRGIFDIDGSPHQLRWVFVWPLMPVGGPLASLMVHQHIGSASTQRNLLNLRLGDANVFSFDWQGYPRLGNNLTRLGVGTGNRSGKS